MNDLCGTKDAPLHLSYSFHQALYGIHTITQRSEQAGQALFAFPAMGKPREVKIKKPEELAKLMRKQSEYSVSVVEQLHRTPIRISLLSLVLSSEPHRKALLMLLNEAYLLMMSPFRKSDWADQATMSLTEGRGHYTYP